MKLYVGVTDNDWYRFLSQLPNVDEVNFWQRVTFASVSQIRYIKALPKEILYDVC
jgi:hypothetical protein